MSAGRSILAGAVAILLAAWGAAPVGPGPALAGVPGCSPATLATVAPGRLTVGADPDNALAPWVLGAGPDGSPWTIGDPRDGLGYEAALGYELARRLGFARNDVRWVATPFRASLAPGRKRFDVAFAQFSITPERARAVSFSAPYYVTSKGVLAIRGTPVTAATRIADLRRFRLAARSGTTSLEAVREIVRPTRPPRAVATYDEAVFPLKTAVIDALVLDYPAAVSLARRRLETNGVVVGRIDTNERYAAVLQRGSPLVACVDRAFESLRADGTLRRLERRWLRIETAAPLLR